MIRVLFSLWLGLWASTGQATDTLRLAVTTSFHNSGLADVLLPQIQTDLNLEIQLLVVGTGQALRLGQAGDVDALLVHAPQAEKDFVAEGHGTHRREIMFNDFVLVGPSHDPAGLDQAATASQAFDRIARARLDFISRGDDSGTHKKERDLWARAQIDPEGAWYKSVGAGMGAALNTASALGGYILTDRASWLNFRNKGDLQMLFAGDPALFNQYGFIPVNPERHAHVKAALTEKLETWLTSETAKELINGYKLKGAQLFTFNAKSP